MRSKDFLPAKSFHYEFIQTGKKDPIPVNEGTCKRGGDTPSQTLPFGSFTSCPPQEKVTPSPMEHDHSPLGQQACPSKQKGFPNCPGSFFGSQHFDSGKRHHAKGGIRTARHRTMNTLAKQLVSDICWNVMQWERCLQASRRCHRVKAMCRIGNFTGFLRCNVLGTMSTICKHESLIHQCDLQQWQIKFVCSYI